MILLFKSMFNVTLNTSHPKAARKVSAPPARDPDAKPSRDPKAEQLWQEWLEDDDWRVGKP